MSVLSKKTRLPKEARQVVVPAKAGTPFENGPPPARGRHFFALLLLLPPAALAAPSSDPVLVVLWSRMDEFHAARGVQRSVQPRLLKRAPPDAAMRKVIDAFLDQNANTGLLVLKGDTILVERYQYER